MIGNLPEYFESEQRYYLDSISYNRIDKEEQVQNYSLNCVDNIEVSVNEATVKLTVKRSLKFEPEELFDLSVSYGAILKLKKDKIDEYNWSKINLAAEVQENGQFVLGNLMSRISLLIAEITSAYGQTPIVLAPAVVPKNQD